MSIRRRVTALSRPFPIVVALTLSALPALAPAQNCAPNCWTISGSVSGPLGEPVAGVDLDLFPAAGGTELILSGDVTAADGSFSLTVAETIPTGLYDLLLNPAPGSPYFPGEVANVFLAGPVTLPAPVVLDAGSFCTGTVIDDAGIGLGEIDLNFFVPGTVIPVLFSGDVTLPDGTFSVLVSPAAYDIEFRVTPLTPGGPYVPVFLENRPLASDLDLGDIVLHDGHLLTGTVLDGGALPVVGADIDVLAPVTGAAVHTPDDDTGAAGQFSVLVPAGTWQVEVDPPTGSVLVAQLTDVAVPIGGASLGVITLPNGFAVSGTTVQAGGIPVPEVDLDFHITATGVEIPTAHDNADPSGDFSVQVVPDTYDIQFRPPFTTGLVPRTIGSVPVTADVSLGAVLLDPGPALSGTVTSSGAPLEGVEVTLEESATGTPVYVFGNDTDAFGQYAIRQALGTYDVTFTPPAGSGIPPSTVGGVVIAGDTLLDHDVAAAAVAPVTGLACSVSAGDVSLGWVLGAPDYDSIEIRRDGVAIDSLPGNAISALDPAAPAGTHDYSVIATRDGSDSPAATCTVVVTGLPAGDFLRGDPNGSAQVDIADAILMLDYLFGGSPLSLCLDAVDANDNGEVNIADPVFLLAYLFTSGPPPPPPFPLSGADPTADSLPICP